MAIQTNNTVRGSRTAQIVVGLLVLFLISTVISLALPTQTLKVTETELVKFQIESKDLDGDTVTYTYSPPLNPHGEWQTTYGDAGEYNIKVTANDGTAETVQYISLIVVQKNQPPSVVNSPLTVQEGELISLKSKFSDPDGDTLTYSFKRPFDDKGEWTPGKMDQGEYNIVAHASDKNETVTATFMITVEDINEAPKIVKLFSDEREARYTEDQTAIFTAAAEDDSEQPLHYRWILDNETIGREKETSYYFNYSSAGKHTLLLSVDDGQENITREWMITVGKKNRKPEVEHIPIVVNEGENAKIDLPKTDIDGDTVAYTHEAPLDENGEWQTGFNDSGEYRLRIEATDGQLNATGFVEITVVDVDRKPIIHAPKEVILFEGVPWNMTISTEDPDTDDVHLFVENAPEGMNFSTGTLSWTPGYDTLRRRGGFVSDVLNALRLEHFFLKERQFIVTVNACGKRECTSSPLLVRVRNVNQPPNFINITNTTVMETDSLSLAVEAHDPDGDLVHYYYTDPFSSRKSTWQTKKGDKGEYTVYVTATDGKNPTTTPIQIRVQKKNSLPEISVDDVVRAREGKEFTLHISTRDNDNDDLTLKLRNPPEGAKFKDGVFVWQPNHELVSNKTDSWWNTLLNHIPRVGTRWPQDYAITPLEFVASDGDAEVVHPVLVRIANVNRLPQAVEYLPEKEITVPVGRPVLFHLTGKDLDNDTLTYTWSFSFHEPKIVGTNTIERTFLTAGRKKVIAEVSDGMDSVSQQWEINVIGTAEEEKKNREERKEPFTIQFYELDLKR
ncbi:hypothetical protein HY496_01335 [Candidatus Woesearchaeota archaeon]|nr:hypothetical protein [Candidatus Woesearchaeota archaeon]